MKPTRNPFAAASRGGLTATGSRKRGATDRRAPLRGGRLLILSALTLLWAPGAMGASAIWNGTTDANWATTTNWSASPVPGVGNIATFNNAGSGSTTLTVGTISLSQVLFDTSSAAAYTLGSGTITFAGGTTTAVSMTNTVTANEIINANLTLGTAIASNTTFSNASTTGLLTLGGNITGGTGGTAAAKTLTLTGAGNLTLSGIIANGGATSLALAKSGTGTVTLSGANTFSGATTVAAGTLTLDYGTSNTTKLAGTLTLSGGTLNLAGGTHVEAVTSTAIGRGASSVTRASGTATLAQLLLTRNAGGTVNYASAVASTTTANVNGIVGPWATVGGADWATGTTSITGYTGYTALLAATGTATPSPTTNYLVSGSLAKSVDFALNTLKLDATGAGQSLSLADGVDIQFGAVVGGILATGANAYTIGVTGNAGRIRSNTSGQALEVVVQQYNTGGLTIAAVIDERGVTSLTKAGTETLILTGANTYTGATTVGSGVLNIRHNTALGTTAGGVMVFTGAALELQNNITVGAEALTLNGTGIGAGGALRNVLNDNTYAGAITLGSATRINSDSGTLTLNAAITGATFGLTVGGAGNTTITSIIGTTTGTLTKDGAGILTLGGVNTYTGVTTLTGGILSVGTIGNGGAAGNLGAATNAAANLVFDGGTLRYTGINSSSNRNFTINPGKVATFEVTPTP